jgi:iron-only hydrogenase group A
MIITIDRKKCQAEAGQTVLEVAKANGLEIPNLCYHPDLTVKANCRMCVVEIKGKTGFFTSCTLAAVPDMEIITDSPAIREARRTNLELIFGEHKLECDDCILHRDCALLRYKKDLNADINKYPHITKNQKTYKFGPIVFNQAKCIKCRNCVDACPVNYLELNGRGVELNIKPCDSVKSKKDCIFCGQCIAHCPVGAIESEGEMEKINLPLLNKDKVMIVSIAPAIRATIGEMFGVPCGESVTEKLATALRLAGFKYVFDTSVAADITTIEEGTELIERLEKNENLPLFTSCCPAWVKLVETNYPELIPNLTTVRSPHIILGGLIKTYWAQKMKIDPAKIVMVSIMPCSAKKFEVSRPELKINGLNPVDHVYTTRELGLLLKSMKIDLPNLKAGKYDDPLGLPSGAGVIYGASGGVMESALRTAYYLLTGKDLTDLNIEAVRGLQGVKKAEITIVTKSGKTKVLKVAVMNNMKNIHKILEELKKDKHAFDYVEIMACPGGCIGGGGQPLPTSEEIRQKRAKGLYNIDAKDKIRTAHDSPVIKKIYQEYFTSEKKIKPICHTTFKPRKKIKVIKNSKNQTLK